jgi:hypothetical protein
MKTETKRRCVVLSVVAYLALFAWNLIDDYRNGTNLAFVMVRCDDMGQLDHNSIRIHAISPWGSETVMVPDKDNVWHIPEYGKRMVEEIHILGVPSSLSQSRWEVSITTSFRPRWRSANFKAEEGVLVFPGSGPLPKQSVIGNYRTLINWQGDAALIGRAFLRSLITSTILFLIARFLARLIFDGSEYEKSSHVHADGWSRFPNRYEKVLLGSALAGVFAFGVWGGVSMQSTLWPGLHDDGVCFTTPIINRVAGIGNQFAVYTPLIQKNKGQMGFTGHGQLYQAITARLLLSANYGSLLTVLHQANLACLFVSFLTITIHVRWHLRTSWLGAAMLGVPSSFATVSILHYLQGRPEHGIPFVILGFALFQGLMRRSDLPDTVQGVKIGLVAAISPLPGAIFGIASVLSECIGSKREVKAVKSAATQAVNAVLAWGIATSSVYDGSLWDWIRQTASASGDYTGNDLSVFPFYWLNQQLVPGIVFIFILGATVSVVETVNLLTCKGQYSRKCVAVICVCLLSYVIWNNGIAYAGYNYCFLCFMPSILLWMISVATSAINFLANCFGNMEGHRLGLGFLALLFAVVLFPGSGFARSAVMQSSIAECGMDYNLAVESIDKLIRDCGPKDIVMIDGFMAARSAVIFDRPPWKFRSKPQTSLEVAEAVLGFEAKYYLVLQSAVDPPEREGFVITENEFNTTPVFCFGQQFERYTPGCGFALYQRSR